MSKIAVIIALLISILLPACGDGSGVNVAAGDADYTVAGAGSVETAVAAETSVANDAASDYTGAAVAEYHKITAKDARDILTGTGEFILVDVRTGDEFREGHIEGAVLIPDYEIAERAAAELPDKNALILVYCRSGRRSANAANALVGLGYTNVYDFGGIIDWPYETVK